MMLLNVTAFKVSLQGSLSREIVVGDGRTVSFSIQYRTVLELEDGKGCCSLRTWLAHFIDSHKNKKIKE